MVRTPVLLLLLATMAADAVRAQEGQLDASQTLFTVMAAMTAASPEASSDPLRESIRQHVLAKKPASLGEIRSFMRANAKPDPGNNLAQYISFALLHDEPPTFKPRLMHNELPPDVLALEAFREPLARFHEEAGIDELWRKVQPSYDQAIERYHEPVSRALLEVNGYLRNPTSGYMGRRFQVYVEVLAPANQVHTRSYKEDYFIVVTPSDQPKVDEVRHAYLHYLLDPLATKYSEKVMRVRGLGDFAQAAPALDLLYKDDFLLLATESLIRAVEARLNRQPAAAQEALAEGFVLTPYFFEQLSGYEKQEAAMRLHFPDMLDAIDLKVEDKRLQQVQFAERKAVRQEPPPVSVAVEQSPVQRALEQAEQLYAARDLENAREAYLNLVKQTDEKTVHSRAYYGLARIAALKNEPDLAEQLFHKTLELSPDPHTRAWSEVYLARLAEGFGERDKAAEHYKAALGIEGAPPGARQAAEQGVQKLVPQ